MIQARRKIPLRLSPIDYIASLVRYEAYITDYEKFLAAYEIEKDEKRRGTFNRMEGNATWDFLNRWPLLLEPIPPEYARNSPSKYLDRLLPAVCAEEDLPPGWFKSAHKFPWPEGRFLAVRINFFRPDSEIIAGINALLKERRFPGFKKSVSKAKGKPDHWKVLDTFKGEGEEDFRKTAETLFPESFRYEDDEDEIEEEAKKEFEARKKTHSLNEAEAWYDNRVNKAKAATWRQGERKRLLTYVEKVIDSCQQKIEMHSPAGDLRGVSVRLRSSGKK